MLYTLAMLGKGLLVIVVALLAVLFFLILLVFIITLFNKVLQFVGNMVGKTIGDFWEWVNSRRE